MVKCIDCANYKEEKCTILKSGLSFPPTEECVCLSFKQKRSV